MVEVEDGFFLGFNRLSIIDLHERSDQPMFSKDGQYGLVFNGEIYNYIELKKELESLGHFFLTESDTEVLLKSYIEWGKNCLDKLNGMFAFVIFDGSLRSLFCARDRFGIKPLYVFQEGEKIAFASEIKQFVSLPNFKSKLNHERSLDFIAWRLFNHTNETLWENVYQLRGGQYIEINLDNPTANLLDIIVEWYGYSRLVNNTNLEITWEEALMNFTSLFKQSTQLRLRADVDIATALSGGIDSSSLCCMIDTISDNGQTTFSVRSNDFRYDEFEYAREVINSVQTSESHNIFVEPGDIFEAIEDLVWYNDEPIASTSIVAQNNLFYAMSNSGFKVALNGQGADEVLGDYGETRPFLYELIKRRKYIQVFRRIQSQVQNSTPSQDNYYKILRHLFYLFFSQYQKKNLVNNSHIDVFKNNDECLRNNPHNQLAQSLDLDVTHNLRDYNILLLKYTSLPMLLQYDDRTSMRHSVESRVPYLDYQLVEFVLSLPSEFKMKNNFNKYILRESVKDVLPSKVYKRISKLGYATPQLNWSVEVHKKEFEKKLFFAANNYNFLDFNKIKMTLKKVEDPNINSLFWRIVIFDIWAKKFNINIS